MILDLQEVFSGSTTGAGVTTGQAITATAISDNVIDLRNFRLNPVTVTTPTVADDGLMSGDLWFVCLVQTAAAGADAAKTMIVTLESSAAVGLTAANVHYTSAAWTGAQLIAGFQAARVKIPGGDYLRYLGVRYTVSAGFTAFNVRSFLTPDVPRNTNYPSGFTVDV